MQRSIIGYQFGKQICNDKQNSQQHMRTVVITHINDPCAMISATPEFTMARLIANAQAMVIKISHDIYFVYLRAGKSLVHAIITVVTAAKRTYQDQYREVILP